MGRMSEIPDNDPVFGSDAANPSFATGASESEIVFGGRADIGHDAANRVVPFNNLSN